MKESIVYFSVKIFGNLIKIVPLSFALAIGKLIGLAAYYFDLKHRTLAYANLKVAFSDEQTFDQIKKLTKNLFIHFGQNIIELLRMPLLNKSNFKNRIIIEGQENIDESLKKGKGVILLAMHFGSWELASISCALLGYDYKVFVKSQDKHSKLNDLLNSYRTCGGSVVLSRGMGIRDLIKSLQNNEAIGMVVDQGGRDGILVPFFNRKTSMSVGAVRLALKLGTPVCFSIIKREKGGMHRLIVEKPIKFINTGNTRADLEKNLISISKKMERYVRENPYEYMWFYKIWKYSSEANIAILSDGKIGHLRQSQSVAHGLAKALMEREISSNLNITEIKFKNIFLARLFSCLSLLSHPFFSQGRLGVFKWFLTENSFQEIMKIKADFIISCGSAIAGVNYMLSCDQNAKSIVNLKPGIINKSRFDLVFLPQHDQKKNNRSNIIFTKGAPNLITKAYIEEQTDKLLNRYSHLKSKVRTKIGIFIGGSSKNVYITEQQIRILIRQVREVAVEINADMLITTSRRTPATIERYLKNALKKESKNLLCIIANEQNVPEAVGGILGLSDIVVVSGDSISMISEAASSGKQTVVFLPQFKEIVLKSINKHQKFIKSLDKQGYILSTSVHNIGRTIYDIAKNKLCTRKLEDNTRIFDAVKKII